MHIRNKVDAGDTIVEVLIVLAVLSLAFGISYGTANGALRRAQNANEHSAALGIINSQVELVRDNYARGINLTGPSVPPSFCLNPAIPTGPPVDTTIPPGSTTTCVYEPTAQNYKVSITYQTPPFGVRAYFDFKVNWQGTGSLGPQQEQLTYIIN